MTDDFSRPVALKSWLRHKRDLVQAKIDYLEESTLGLLDVNNQPSGDGARTQSLLSHLASAEVRLNQLFMAHPAPLLITNPNNSVLVANLATRKLLLRMGKINDVEASIKLMPIDYLLPGAGEALELKLVTTDQKAVFFQIETSEVRWDDEPAVVWLLHDVTLDVQARQKLEQAVNELEQINQVKTEFISLATHEFRTPLAGSYSSIELLEAYVERFQQDPGNSSWLDKVVLHAERSKQSIKRLEALVEEMLVMERVDSGTVSLTIESIELASFINEIVDVNQAIAELKGITINVDANDIGIHTDRKALRHILTNLMSNAIKFSDKDTEVYIKVTNRNNRCAISVKDRGIGIPEEAIGYLGDAFFRAENAASINGTGLGLRIVKKYVELLRGKLRIYSSEGHGSEFIVELPERY